MLVAATARSTATSCPVSVASTATSCSRAPLDRFVGDAPVITDDYAPIDQWLREDTTS